MTGKKPTPQHIGDWCKILCTGYQNASDDYRRDPSPINCQCCEAFSIMLQNLARAVAEQMPTLWPELRLVSSRSIWHADPAFDWGGAEAELRKIEAAAISGNHAIPAQYLTNWREILIALDMKNNREDQSKVRILNEKYDGPIVIPGQGSQPKAEKNKLIAWWNGLAAKWTTVGSKTINAAATVANQYEYGREGVVVPDIAGGVKKRKGTSHKKT